MPEKELCVTVDVGCQGLVESDEILISALGLTELARCRAVLQTLDGIDVRLTVRVGVRVPLAADAGVGASALPLLELLKLLVQGAGSNGEDAGKNKLGKLVLGVLDVLDDGSDGSVYSMQGLVERERARKLGRLEVGERERRRKSNIGRKRCALGGSRVLGKCNGRSGDSQNGCGE